MMASVGWMVVAFFDPYVTRGVDKCAAHGSGFLSVAFSAGRASALTQAAAMAMPAAMSRLSRRPGTNVVRLDTSAPNTAIASAPPTAGRRR